MSRVTTLVLSLTILLGCTAVVSACGQEDRSHLLPAETVAGIEQDLDSIQELSAEGECLDALDVFKRIEAQISEIDPDLNSESEVDPELVTELRRGLFMLIPLVQGCDGSTIGDTGTTGETATTGETTVETAPTGDGGETDQTTTGPTGPAGTTGNKKPQKPQTPTKPQKPAKPTPKPTPEPTPPKPPEPTPAPDPPVEEGPGSGGFTPNQ